MTPDDFGSIQITKSESDHAVEDMDVLWRLLSFWTFLDEFSWVQKCPVQLQTTCDNPGKIAEILALVESEWIRMGPNVSG